MTSQGDLGTMVWAGEVWGPVGLCRNHNRQRGREQVRAAGGESQPRPIWRAGLGRECLPSREWRGLWGGTEVPETDQGLDGKGTESSDSRPAPLPTSQTDTGTLRSSVQEGVGLDLRFFPGAEHPQPPTAQPPGLRSLGEEPGRTSVKITPRVTCWFAGSKPWTEGGPSPCYSGRHVHNHRLGLRKVWEVGAGLGPCIPNQLLRAVDAEI